MWRNFLRSRRLGRNCVRRLTGNGARFSGSVRNGAAGIRTRGRNAKQGVFDRRRVFGERLMGYPAGRVIDGSNGHGRIFGSDTATVNAARGDEHACRGSANGGCNNTARRQPGRNERLRRRELTPEDWSTGAMTVRACENDSGEVTFDVTGSISPERYVQLLPRARHCT